MCKPVSCPDGSIKDNSTSPATCKCKPQYYGDGFTWEDGNITSGDMWNRFWKPVDNAYTSEMPAMVCKWKTDTANGGRECPENSHFDELTGTCKCAYAHTGSVTWNNTGTSWTGSCTAAPCPANSVEMPPANFDPITGEPRRRCECDYGYTGTVTWNTTSNTVGCVA